MYRFEINDMIVLKKDWNRKLIECHLSYERIYRKEAESHIGELLLVSDTYLKLPNIQFVTVGSYNLSAVEEAIGIRHLYHLPSALFRYATSKDIISHKILQ